MFLDLSFDMSGLLATLRECERRGLDVGPALRKAGREKRAAIISIIASGKGLKPLAPSTIRAYERQAGGDQKFTQRGEARAAYLAKLEREHKRIKGLKAWAEKKYGKRYVLFGSRIPSSIQKRIDRFDAKMRKVQAETEARQSHQVFSAGQVGAESHLEGGPTVELKVVQEGRRRRVRVTSPGYRPDLNVAFPRHLRKPGATFVIPAAALTVTQRGHYSVKPTALVRTSHGGGGGGTGGEHKILGKVPLTIYYKVIRRGVAFLLVVGSHWPIDYVHNTGDEHTPQRLHIELTAHDVSRIRELIVIYCLAPFKRGNVR